MIEKLQKSLPRVSVGEKHADNLELSQEILNPNTLFKCRSEYFEYSFCVVL